MSKETKILMKDAKTAFQKKQYKEAEGICQVSNDFVFRAVARSYTMYKM